MPEKSMKEKVEELGFNSDEFGKDMFEINDAIVDKCWINLNYSREALEKHVYPLLKKFKEKYNINVPLSVCGVDLQILDRQIDNKLWEKEQKK